MPASDKTLICKFWQMGRCRRSNCDFAHGEEEKRAARRTRTCQFFASGHCRLGPECLYRHAEDASGDEKDVGSGCEVSTSTTASEGGDDVSLSGGPDGYKKDWQQGKYDKTKICVFWQEGRCQRAACKYAHGEEERRLACSAIPCKRWRNGNCQEDCCFAHAAGSQPSSSASQAQATGDRASDKTLICKFWLKNRCQRNNCNFAHGEEEKRRACKGIRCLFQASGHCRLGSDCLYAHEAEAGEKVTEQDRDRHCSTDDLNSVVSTTPSPSLTASTGPRIRPSWADLIEGDEDTF